MSKDITKIMKLLPDGFAEQAEAAKDEELKQLIVQCEGNLFTIAEAKANDEKLLAAKESVKEWQAPYNDAKKTQMAKIAYICHVFQGRGVDMEKLGS